MAKQTKKQQIVAKLDAEKLYSVDEALATLREHKAKFDETVEVAMNLGVDPRHADQMVRGMVSLPSGTGKDVKVAVFAKGDNAEKALAAGADKVGAEDLMEDMQNGNLDYDRVIATPDMMGVVGRLGKVLGPKGLMPNPKLGTVTPNVEQAVKDAKGGQVEFRVEKQGIIHSGIGKRLLNVLNRQRFLQPAHRKHTFRVEEGTTLDTGSANESVGGTKGFDVSAGDGGAYASFGLQANN